MPVKRFLREFKLDNAAELNVGDELAVTSFEVGDRIDVTGISKGKGFAGSIKRHGQHWSEEPRLGLPQRLRLHGRVLRPVEGS